MATGLVSGSAAAGYWFACRVIFEVLFFHCVQIHTDQASFWEKKNSWESPVVPLGFNNFFYLESISWPCPAEQTPTSPGLELWYFCCCCFVWNILSPYLTSYVSHSCRLEMPKDELPNHNCIKHLRSVVQQQQTKISELEKTVAEHKHQLGEQVRIFTCPSCTQHYF